MTGNHRLCGEKADILPRGLKCIWSLSVRGARPGSRNREIEVGLEESECRVRESKANAGPRA